MYNVAYTTSLARSAGYAQCFWSDCNWLL